MKGHTRLYRTKSQGLSVAEFIPAGMPLPTEVHLIVEVAGQQFIIAFKSADAMMETLLHMIEAGARIWPEVGQMWAEVE